MPRPRKPRPAGFTLVELLVVLVILSLTATLVVVAMPDPGGSVQMEAERFAARAKAVRDSAIVESRPALLRVDGGGYAVARRAGGEWQDSARHDWEDGTRVDVGGADRGQTRFDSTGLAEPLRIVLRRRERQVEVAIGQDGSVHVRR